MLLALQDKGRFPTKSPPAQLRVCAVRAAGASAGNYFLGGGTPSTVVEGRGRLDVTDVAAARDPSGHLQALFTLRLPQASAQLTALPFLCGPALGCLLAPTQLQLQCFKCQDSSALFL